MEPQNIQEEDNCDVTNHQPSHSIKQMKEELLDLMTSFRGNQAEWWGDDKKDTHGNQFEQLLEVYIVLLISFISYIQGGQKTWKPGI